MLSGAGPTASSIFQNPTVLSSGIMAGTSLLSGLFGGQAEEDALKQQQALNQQQFDAEMAYKQAALAQALEIAKINAAGGGGGGSNQGAAIAAQLKIAKAKAIENAAAMKGAAMQLPLQYDNRAATAQNTGAQSGAYFNNLAQILQAPALRSA
jgi:predicted esterase